jgi:hypothetical protein
VGTYVPGATDADFVEAFGNTETECLSLAFPATGQNALRNAVNAGTILYDAAATATCAATYPSMTCEQFWTATMRPASCDAALIGTLPNGSSCLINGECVSGRCLDGICSAE